MRYCCSSATLEESTSCLVLQDYESQSPLGELIDSGGSFGVLVIDLLNSKHICMIEPAEISETGDNRQADVINPIWNDENIANGVPSTGQSEILETALDTSDEFHLVVHANCRIW